MGLSLLLTNFKSIKKVILFISFLNSIFVSKFLLGSNNNPSINFLDFSNFKFSIFNLLFSSFNLLISLLRKSNCCSFINNIYSFFILSTNCNNSFFILQYFLICLNVLFLFD